MCHPVLPSEDNMCHPVLPRRIKFCVGAICDIIHDASFIFIFGFYVENTLLSFS